MNRLEELRNYLTTLETDFAKFYEKENHAAGTRVRKAMQELKKMANTIRSEVQDIKSKANNKA